MGNKIAYILLGLAVLSILHAVAIAQPVMEQVSLPTPQTFAVETIFTDLSHHHLGDDFKEGLIPKEPEGLVYTATFHLDSSVDIRSAELTLTAKSVVPSPTDEFLDKVYLNEIEIGALNDHIPSQTPENIAVDIAIPIHPAMTILKHGTNTLIIKCGNADGSNYDDFEFYNLAINLTKINITEIELVTLEPPLKVAWTYDLFGPYTDNTDIDHKSWIQRAIKQVKSIGASRSPYWWIPSIPIIAAENVIYLGRDGIKAIDADTGELLWSAGSADLAYKDGVLYALRIVDGSSGDETGELLIIDAMDAKTGKLLWSKEYLWSNEYSGSKPYLAAYGTPAPVIVVGNTLFVSTPYDKYVLAIDTENGNLKWRYEHNIKEFGTDGINCYHLSSPVGSGNTGVFRYYAPHSNYTEPIAIEPGEEPKTEPPMIKEGLIALNANTGKKVWEYAYAGEAPFFEPLIYEDLVYTTSGGNITALSLKSGEEVWKAKGGGGATAAVKDGKLFVDSDKPFILNADSGEILKEYHDSKMRFSSSAIT
ncbi:MAG: PQQ-like beta-propeller repeat protein, partial [archaeon]|nr:PQQ-like beta-propeller repeat protein [archaeon]